MGRSRCPATSLPNLTARTQWPSFYSKADGVVFVMDCRNVERFPEVNDALMVSRTATVTGAALPSRRVCRSCFDQAHLRCSGLP